MILYNICTLRLTKRYVIKHFVHYGARYMMDFYRVGNTFFSFLLTSSSAQLVTAD